MGNDRQRVKNRGARGGGKVRVCGRGSRPKLVIPCRIKGLVYNGCIALRPRPVYIRVQDLGGKAPRDTYGSIRYVYI